MTTYCLLAYMPDSRARGNTSRFEASQDCTAPGCLASNSIPRKEGVVLCVYDGPIGGGMRKNACEPRSVELPCIRIRAGLAPRRAKVARFVDQSRGLPSHKVSNQRRIEEKSGE